MSDFTFLHAADLHLDTPFEGAFRADEALGAALRDASLTAWDRLVDAAIDRQVAFVVLAGDIYDGPERGIRAQLRFRAGLQRLSDAGIATCIVHGNHDPLEEGWSALRDLPDRVVVFEPGAPQAIPIEREGELLAVVHGTSYATRAERENLARRFRRGSERALHVGLLHCNVEGQQGHDPYAPCSLADLRAAGMDYWALGHVHTRQVLSQEPWVVYPGNLQGRSQKPAERGEKGAVLVEVEGSAVRRVDLLPLAPIRFEELVADVGAAADLADLQRQIADEVQALLATPGLDGLAVRLRLEGRGEVHRDLVRDPEDFRRALEDVAGAQVAWERIEIRSGPPIDRERLLEREDFAGALLRRLDELHADPAALAALAAEVDGELRRGELGRLIDGPDEAELQTLATAIEGLAIERLGGGT